MEKTTLSYWIRKGSLVALIATLFISPIITTGQDLLSHHAQQHNIKLKPVELRKGELPKFISEVTTDHQYATQKHYSHEIKNVVKLLSSKAVVNPILIDVNSEERSFIISQSAERLSTTEPKAKIYAIDWNSLLSAAKNADEFANNLDQIITFAESSKGKAILYIGDIDTVSNKTFAFGSIITDRF